MIFYEYSSVKILESSKQLNEHVTMYVTNMTHPFHNINYVLMVDEQLLTCFVVTAVNNNYDKTADQLASNIECHWMWNYIFNNVCTI